MDDLKIKDYESLLVFFKGKVKAKEKDIPKKATDRFYWSKEWRKVREIVLDRDCHECVLCRAKGKVSMGRLVIHHIIPLRARWDLRTSESNLVALCHRCHDLVHDQGTSKHDKKDEPEWW